MIWGLCPQPPGVYRFIDQSIIIKAARIRYGPYTSVTPVALRSLPSVALSSERVIENILKKTFIQVIYNTFKLL